VVAIANGAGLTTMVTSPSAFAFAESFTCTVTVDVATLVGVPEKTPPLENVIPAGKVPEAIEYVYGGVPPLAPTVAE
jgi:hypothetical protein